MKTKISVFVLAIACSTMASAQTVDEIVAKFVKATGGAEKIRAVNSIVTKNAISVQGLDIENTATVMVNKGIRTESMVMGNKAIQAYDGKTAWQLVPAAMGGTGEPQEMTEGAAKSMAAQMDPFPLFDYAAKKTRLEYLGPEQLNGNPSWHLKMTNKDSAVSEIWVDSNSGFLRKQKITQDGIMTDIHFSNEKEQDGLFFATHMEISSAAMGAVTMDTKNISINPVIDPAIFQFPNKK